MTAREWSEAPATDEQMAALRRIAMQTGVTFAMGISRGRAWQRICKGSRVLSAATVAACAPPSAFDA